MKYFDINTIEKNIEELKTELIKEMSANQSYYVKLTGISKQQINRFVHTGEALSLKKMIHIYKAIQAVENGMDKC